MTLTQSVILLALAKSLITLVLCIVWNGNATDQNGNGFTNNKIFGSRYQSVNKPKYNDGAVNDAIASKIGRYTDISTVFSYNNIYGTIMSATNLKNNYAQLMKFLILIIWFGMIMLLLSFLLYLKV